ncbi:hypothetical protein NLJ89_g8950 [Agrocybe chaxingu]|uniref:F-box domain-containing protein n=1 Tax=Agrocybe chaxingu TaxID=84603 RepID=A0A9W8MQB7_9AGAR|nr:hypothetical protein NLJ89_g8950 [Agrocybe chaxingu]
MEGRNSSVQEDASTVPVIITHEFLRASKNNDAPLQETLQVARERREEAIAKTADIAAQIRELQAQQRALAQEITRHKSDVLVYDRVLAPIRRVPPDILREIARHALPLHPYPSLTESPLSLSHVSSAWRKAVLSSAVLWDILVLYFKEADSRSFKRADRMAKEWFSRAKARHLTLFVKADFDSEDDPSAPRTFRRFLSNLSARVHHVAFCASRVDDLLSTLIDGTLSWPNLKTLEFIEKQWLNWPEGHEPPPLLSTFQTAQSLRRVRINYEFGPGTSAEHHNCDPAVFVAMTVTDSGDFILPNLTSLRVSFQGSYNLEYTTIFTNMLLSRVRPMGVSERMQLVEFSATYGKKGSRQLRSALSTVGEQGILLRWLGEDIFLPKRGPIFDSVFTGLHP